MSAHKHKKPVWVIEKERAKRASGAETVWLFGLHAVRDALMNPARDRLRLVLTKNAANKLAPAIAHSGMTPELTEPRKFNVPLDPHSVHQGAALEVKPLQWGNISELCAPRGEHRVVVLLDRVTDPHNVGAILRSAEVFGAHAVIAPKRHAAPETGALAKAASGALERQPYVRVGNLRRAMETLAGMGYYIIGLDGAADVTLKAAVAQKSNHPIALAFGAEGSGLRPSTQTACHINAKIPFPKSFGSLNVSNAAAVALYEVTAHK